MKENGGRSVFRSSAHRDGGLGLFDLRLSGAKFSIPPHTMADPNKPRSNWSPAPPAELTSNSSLELLSQGAEARVWLVGLNESIATADSTAGRKRTVNVGSSISVPQLESFAQQPSPLLAIGNGDSRAVICKERFPKKYRHPRLDVSLTKSRTKGEARSLIRCQRAGVPCPNVLAIAQWPIESEEKRNGMSPISYCLFMEKVDGCTVRQYLELKSDDNVIKSAATEPALKRSKCNEDTLYQPQQRVTTVIDADTLRVANTVGAILARMHAAGIIHGDLTTSNIMIRNPPAKSEESWNPQLVLIDFGLASSISQTNPGKKAKSHHKQQHNAEEKAVDLYVLERAFLSTHPDSDKLVDEVWRGYCEYEDVSLPGGEYRQIADAVMKRLDQVRMRGRKRECFG